MSGAPLRLGVVGLGRGQLFTTLLGDPSRGGLVAVCDVDPERLDRAPPGAARYADYDAFLRHPMDAVIVCTPLPLHASQTIAALKSGHHVLCEVPAASTLAECEAIVRAVEESGRKYMLAENACFGELARAWSVAIDGGALGELVYGEAEYVHDARELSRAKDGAATWRATLPPIHYATHSLGPLLYLTGDRCTTATGLHSASKVGGEHGTLDLEVGLFRTERGALLKVLCGFAVERHPAFHWYVLYGTKGCLESARRFADAGGDAYASEVAGAMRLQPLPRDVRGVAEGRMLDAFVDCIVRDARPPIDVYDAMDYTAPGLCAHLSAERGGEPVAIPSFRRGPR